jgi:hypothetical protein
MSDNLTVTAGTGTTVATDQVGTAHYQRVKVTDGTADSENHLIVDSSGNAMVKLAAGTAAFGKLAANSGVDIGDVDVTSVAVHQVNASQLTSPWVTNASVVNAPIAVNASQVTSPWITNASVVNTVTTNASLVNIQQVNASQLSSPWITNASVVNAPIAVNASQVTSPWLTNASIVNAPIATNASIVNIQQVNASQLTSPWITNASIVNAPITTNASLVNIQQVNASQLSSPWITNASVVNAPIAVNASQTTSPWITNASVVNAPIAVNASQVTSPWVTNASVVNSHSVSASVVEDFIIKQTFVQNTADFAASATACALWTPAAGKKFAVTDIIVSASASGTLTLFDHADGTASRVAKFNFAANGGAVINYRKPRISSTADYVLKYTASNTAAGSVTVSGYEV